MIEPTNKLLRDSTSELVFGLVVPVGADLERLEADLIDLVGLYGHDHRRPPVPRSRMAGATTRNSCPKTRNTRERSRPSDTRRHDVVRLTA